VRRDGLLIGEVAARSGMSRKALRLYEAAGILPTPRRTNAGYRVYGHDTLALLEFVTQARRLAFTLDEIKEIRDQAIRPRSLPPRPRPRGPKGGRPRQNAHRFKAGECRPADVTQGLAVGSPEPGARLSPHRTDEGDGGNHDEVMMMEGSGR
jgi:DNA-binding transcriptional MerR regulator